MITTFSLSDRPARNRLLPPFAGLCCVLFLLRACPLHAGSVRHNAESNLVVVTGFPEESPATLDHVLSADARHGWNRIVYDRNTDIYTLKASLTIGSDDDWGTFFQIGRQRHPRETLVLHGNLTVAAPRYSGALVKSWRDYDGSRRDHRYRISNRLTLGVENRQDVRPEVRIACPAKNAFSVSVLTGDTPPKPPEGRWAYPPVGEWYMFNAVLTSAIPDPEHTYAASIALSHAGVNYKMRNSTFSWWSGSLFRAIFFGVRGLDEEDKTVRGMVFTDGDNSSGPFHAVDCVFRNLQTARFDSGGLRCRFEHNARNVGLSTYHVGIVWTDCVLGPQKEPFLLPRSTRPEAWLRNYSVYNQSSDLDLVLNPGVIWRRSLPVHVRDPDGRPVPRAAAIVECPGDVDHLNVVRGLAVTDENGITPADAEGRALVITTRELRPTGDPAQPEVIHHDYRLRVTAQGYHPYETSFSTAQPLTTPMEVTLHKTP